MAQVENLKQFVIKNFEKILVFLILVTAFLGTYLIEEKSIILNFYYLPVLVGSYLLGKRMGLLISIFSILVIIFFVIIFPDRFLTQRLIWHDIAGLCAWASFLILASIAVGALYELNERRLMDLRKAYIGILEILSKYLESTDTYTKGHSLRVSEYAQEIALAMELPKGKVENIRVAGLLHDIGKIEISGEVIRKAADLTAEERVLINTHASKGANILSSVGAVLKEVVPIVLAHHKYFISNPQEKEGEQSAIPLGARIVAVADSFDAMVTDRPYRKGMPPWKALEELISKAGSQFDPQVIEAFKYVLTGRMEMV